MNTLPQTNLELLVQETLRAQIGEQPYSWWFASTSRFVFSGDAMTVLVVNDVFLNWIEKEYSDLLLRIARQLLGPGAMVFYRLFTPTAKSAAEILPIELDSSQSANANPTLKNTLPTKQTADDSPAATPVKRGRGRPRKNVPVETPRPVPSLNPRATLVDATFLPKAPELARAPERDLFAPAQTNAVQTQTPPTPVKRGRGRPRKNAAPLQASVAESTPIAAEPASFADAYARSVNLFQTAEQTRPNEFAELSPEERAALAIGSFADADATPAETPARRRPGRPKGSTKKVPPIPAADATTDSSDEEIVRDARGFNIVRRPIDRPTGKSAESSGRRFATFETFVEGASNSNAKKAVELTLSLPGQLNPLIIWGSTSVGKTHLLEAACDSLARVRSPKQPLFMTAEQFTTDFIQSLRGGGAFRNRFKNISLFALDDLHFLEGKQSTQTELLNVYDFLRSHGVQMIFSANRDLTEIKLKSELQTRLQSGMSCEIGVPERETLAAILRQFALERRLAISEEVCRYVVSRFATHARQLSGALNRIYAAHLTSGAPITLDLAREALSDMRMVAPRNVRLEDVERAVQDIFGLEPNALKSASRAKNRADPRAIAMWIARKHTRSALSEIGEFFGGRRHSSVVAAQKKVDKWRDNRESISALGGLVSVDDVIRQVERALGATPM